MAGKYDDYEKILYGNSSLGTSQLAKNQGTISNYKARLAAGGVNPEQATDNRNFLEKALNLRQDQNFLFDIFEVLNRPQEALFGGIESMQQGGDFLEGAKQGITGNKNTQFKDILMNTGMFDDTTYEDLLKQGEKEGLGTKLKALDLVDLLGFGGDVMLDPTNIPVIPGIKAGGKLASVDDAVGALAKKGIKGATKGVDKLIETGLKYADETKGVLDDAGNVVKLGYANKAADTAADLQKYVKNADELIGAGAKMPKGRLEAYKGLKDDLSNMFKVSDKSKQAILKGREANVAGEEFKRIAGAEIGKAKTLVDDAAKQLNIDPNKLSENLMLFAESKANREMTLGKVLDLAREGTLDATDTTKKALEDILQDMPERFREGLDMSISTTKGGKIKLGKGWNEKVLKANNFEGFDPSRLEQLVNLGDTYSDASRKEIEALNNLYETNETFRNVADEVIGDAWKGGNKPSLVDRLNSLIDEGGFGTDLSGKYSLDQNVGYAPHTRNFNFDEVSDFSTIPEGTLKGNTGVLAERRLIGSARERNEIWEAGITKNYDNLNDVQKKYVDTHRKLFEEDYLKAVENRYFNQLPSTLKQNKIVNDVLINQTFGDKDTLKELKKLQGDIHKFSLSGDKEALKTASEKYNKLSENLNIKFLTDYDNKIPVGYTKLEGKTLDNMTKKFKIMGSQLGNANELDDLMKVIKSQKGGIAIDNNILRMIEVTADTKQMNSLSRAYNSWLNHFKKWKTASPSFLMNNLVGNSSNMYLSGINFTEQAKYGATVADIISNGEKYANTLLEGGELTAKQKKIADYWNSFNQMGFGSGKRSLVALDVQDMPDTIRKYFMDGSKPKGAEWLKDGIPYFNNLANNYMDNSARLTVMLKAMDDPSYIKSLGITTTGMEGVRDAISKVMFDPQMMTDFERNTMKKIVPFYTYAKNNLVYHLDNMGQNLGRYQRVMKGVKGLQDAATNGNSDDMADYIKNSLYIPIPGLGKDGQYTVLRANLPFGQLLELADDPLKELVNMTSPLIKTPYELATNQSTFTGREIEKFPGERSKSIPFLTKRQETMLSGFSGLDVPLKTGVRLLEGATADNPLGGLQNTFTMTSSIDTDKLSRSYDEITNLQNLMKQYEQKGYQFSTMSELKKANKNGTIEGINAIFNKYGINTNNSKSSDPYSDYEKLLYNR